MALTALLWTVTAHPSDEEIITIGRAAVAAKTIYPDSERFTDVIVIIKNGQQSAPIVSANSPSQRLSPKSRKFRRTVEIAEGGRK
jgi:hypothetical protein